MIAVGVRALDRVGVGQARRAAYRGLGQEVCEVKLEGGGGHPVFVERLNLYLAIRASGGNVDRGRVTGLRERQRLAALAKRGGFLEGGFEFAELFEEVPLGGAQAPAHAARRRVGELVAGYLRRVADERPGGDGFGYRGVDDGGNGGAVHHRTAAPPFPRDPHGEAPSAATPILCER